MSRNSGSAERCEALPARRSLLEGLGELEPASPSVGPRRRPALPQRGLRLLAVFIISASAVIAAWRVLSAGAADLSAASRTRTLIDAETGEVFKDHRITDGASFPLPNPKTGHPTLFPAERCYWTREGEAKWAPTFVFVPPDRASADCPDCGREVIPHNPRPPEAMMLEALRRHREGR